MDNQTETDHDDNCITSNLRANASHAFLCSAIPEYLHKYTWKLQEQTNNYPYSIGTTRYPTNQPTNQPTNLFGTNTLQHPDPPSPRFFQISRSKTSPYESFPLFKLQREEVSRLPSFLQYHVVTRHHDSIQRKAIQISPRQHLSPETLIEAAAAPSTYKHPTPPLRAKKKECICVRAYVYISNLPVTLENNTCPSSPSKLLPIPPLKSR
jgi:hypothetical protein